MVNRLAFGTKRRRQYKMPPGLSNENVKKGGANRISLGSVWFS